MTALGSSVPLSDPNLDGDLSDSLSFAIPYYLSVKIDNEPYLVFDGKFPGLKSVVSAFRSSTSGGNLIKSIHSDYSITENDDVLLVYGNTSIFLPSAVNIKGRIFTIKNMDSSHGTKVKTIQSQVIDNVNRDTETGGTALLLQEQFDDINLISNGQNWLCLGLKKGHFVNYYTKPEINSLLLEKADESNVYSRIYLDNQLGLKANISDMQAELDKYDLSITTTQDTLESHAVSISQNNSDIAQNAAEITNVQLALNSHLLSITTAQAER